MDLFTVSAYTDPRTTEIGRQVRERRKYQTSYTQ